MKKKIKNPFLILSIMVLIGVIASIVLSYLRVNRVWSEVVTWYLQGVIVGSLFAMLAYCVTVWLEPKENQ